MVLSLSHAFDNARPAELSDRAEVFTGSTLDAKAWRERAEIDRRIELDPRAPAGLIELRRMSMLWPELADSERQAWLDRLDIVPPLCLFEDQEVAVLPGGGVALRGPDGMLVCDPVDAVIFSQAEVKHLRRALRGRADVSTLVHTEHGVMLRHRVPKDLPAQAVTIVPNAARLPIRVALTGPVLIQWGLHGAVARPLVEAPALLSLAISIAASPRVQGVPGQVHRGPVITAESWQATDASDRWRLIAGALMEHISDLIADTVCDDLRLALMDACVHGPESLAHRIARALAVVPGCFVADPKALPGAPAAGWRRAMAHVAGSPHPRALLGLDGLTDPLGSIRALRGIMEYAEVMAFDEDGEVPRGGAVNLHSDTALFLARISGPRGRLAIAIPTPASPVDLYSLAFDAARLVDGRVTAVAPAWGFCHRVDPSGAESGNAGWFGMGAGLDEVDVLLDDPGFVA